MNNKHYFKGFIFKWGNNTCSLEQLAYKAIDKKQIALTIRTSGTQSRDPALSTDMVRESFEGCGILSNWVFKEGRGRKEKVR